MKKVTIEFIETLSYNREIIIEVPNDVTERELDKFLNAVERGADYAGDVPFLLAKHIQGAVIVDPPCEDLDSPDRSEIEFQSFDID
ncbi:hypothetical protein P9B03_04010 [Metasolibacillus meyeri]|uniref:Uncharacterized protein n=1 Tax=Metasolibacillus meyeri TaxID=1071052 RepID=A0AAW9NQQ9_9BACL|nr:hypothetical protein [Metasolibacillus meyeri]MEC1177639.1 hypothetical protein [Metasolibacillus meyeri]